MLRKGCWERSFTKLLADKTRKMLSPAMTSSYLMCKVLFHGLWEAMGQSSDRILRKRELRLVGDLVVHIGLQSLQVWSTIGYACQTCEIISGPAFSNDRWTRAWPPVLVYVAVQYLV